MSKNRLLRFFQSFQDIRKVVFLYFILQLFFITQPPLEPAHAWRQCVTNMIARNLSEGEGDLFHPVIDYGRDSKGIMASEFPVMQYIISLGYRSFGFNHWLGRLVNLVVSCFGFLAFFYLVRQFFTNQTAYYATFGLIISLWLIYSRKSMPDTFSVSLVLISGALMTRFLGGGKWLYLVIGALMLSLGVLAKIPSLVVLAPIGLLVFYRKVPINRRLWLVLFSILALIPVWYWYFSWVPHLVALDNNPLFFPRSLSQGWSEISNYPKELVEQFSFHSFFSFLAFGLSFTGIPILVARKNWSGVAVLAISVVIMFVFILKTGMVFPLHSYYMVPFAPVMALCLGYTLSAIPRKYAIILLVLASGESIANQQDDFRFKNGMKAYLTFEEVADSIQSDSSLIVCNGGENPQFIYFLNRKGWSLTEEEINQRLLDSLQTNGVRYYYRLKSSKANFEPNADRVYNGEAMEVYSLKK